MNYYEEKLKELVIQAAQDRDKMLKEMDAVKNKGPEHEAFRSTLIQSYETYVKGAADFCQLLTEDYNTKLKLNKGGKKLITGKLN